MGKRQGKWALMPEIQYEYKQGEDYTPIPSETQEKIYHLIHQYYDLSADDCDSLRDYLKSGDLLGIRKKNQLPDTPDISFSLGKYIFLFTDEKTAKEFIHNYCLKKKAKVDFVVYPVQFKEAIAKIGSRYLAIDCPLWEYAKFLEFYGPRIYQMTLRTDEIRDVLNGLWPQKAERERHVEPVNPERLPEAEQYEYSSQGLIPPAKLKVLDGLLLGRHRSQSDWDVIKDILNTYRLLVISPMSPRLRSYNHVLYDRDYMYCFTRVERAIAFWERFEKPRGAENMVVGSMSFLELMDTAEAKRRNLAIDITVSGRGCYIWWDPFQKLLHASLLLGQF